MREEHPLEHWATIGKYVLVAGSVFCIVVFSYLFYHYTLTGQREFTSPLAAVLYYYIPVALATLLFAALQFERSQRINLAILSMAFGLSIYAGELFLAFTDTVSLAARPIWGGNQVIERQDEVKRLAQNFGVEFDTRSKLEVVSDLRAQGIDAVPSIGPRHLLAQRANGSMRSVLNIKGDEVVPLGGVSNRVTVFCNETGEYTIYDSDEHGFHNPTGLWRSGRVAILALGDSFTAGGCVASDEGFVALVRKRYPGTLNLGMASQGPLMMLAALKEYGRSIEPKIVLWFYYEENDIKNLAQEAGSQLLMRYLDNDFSQNLLERQADVDRTLLHYIEAAMIKDRPKVQAEAATGTAIIPKLMAIAKLSTFRQKSGLVFGTQDSEIEAELDLFQTILSRAKSTASEWGGTLYFVYLPAWHRYGNPRLAGRTGVRHYDRVLSLVKRLGIRVIDVHPAFQARTGPLSLFSFRRFGHYNERGHAVVAEEVLKVIAAER